MAGFNIDDYVTVPERVVSFYEKYPDGSLQSEVIELSDTRVVMRAYAYRTPDDVRPGIGHSMLGIPGSTPYTKGSEVENCETSAVGRAIAMLGFHVKKSIASSDEIRNKGGGEVRADVEKGDDGSLIGIVQVGDKATSDLLLRNSPDGPVIGFRLRGEKGGILVRARGPLAVQLQANKANLVGARVSCWGKITTETFRAKNAKADTSYQVLDADRIRIPEVGELPVRTEEDEADAEYIRQKESSPSDAAMDNATLTEAESEAIWDAVEKMGA